MHHFGIFYELLSTKIVNVARFARNIKCDFFYNFQTQCSDVKQVEKENVK